MDMKRFFIVLALLFALLPVIGQALAQDLQATARAEAQKLAAAKRSLSPPQQKINSNLREILQKMQASGIALKKSAVQSIKESFSTPLVSVDNNGRIEVTLRTTGITPALLSQLSRLGFEVTATTENLPVTASHQMIAGWVPFDRLESI